MNVQRRVGTGFLGNIAGIVPVAEQGVELGCSGGAAHLTVVLHHIGAALLDVGQHGDTAALTVDGNGGNGGQSTLHGFHRSVVTVQIQANTAVGHEILADAAGTVAGDAVRDLLVRHADELTSSERGQRIENVMSTEAVEHHRRHCPIVLHVKAHAHFQIFDVDGAVVRPLIGDAVVEGFAILYLRVPLERVVAVEYQHTIGGHALLHAKAALPDALLGTENLHV